MPKYIDVEKLDLAPNADGVMNGVLFVSKGRSGGKTAAMVQRALKHMIDNAPAEDVIKVVKCMECKHRERCDGMLYCNHTRGLAGPVMPDYYCVFGERRRT